PPIQENPMSQESRRPHTFMFPSWFLTPSVYNGTGDAFEITGHVGVIRLHGIITITPYYRRGWKMALSRIQTWPHKTCH
ncbi:hypothetical protein BGZ47_003698, partial [Haplosporangium gracile]